MRIIFLLLALSVPLTAQSSPILQVLNQQQADWNRHDLQAFMSGYWNSPSLTFFGAKKTSGWQATLDRYRKTYQSDGHEMGNWSSPICKSRNLLRMQHSSEAVGS